MGRIDGILMNKKINDKIRIYVFDIDDTICHTIDGDYNKCIPKEDVVREINFLYDNGNEIILYTSRGTLSGTDWRDLTLKQLDSWGVKYSKLLFGKLNYDVWIDDKAINAYEWRLFL